MIADLRSTVKLWYIPTEKNVADIYSRTNEVGMLQIRADYNTGDFNVKFFTCVDEIFSIANALEQGVYIRAYWLKNFWIKLFRLFNKFKILLKLT